MDDDRLADRHVIVTGAAQGIGRGIAARVARAGADVTLFDTNLEAASDTADAIREHGVDATALEIDVSDSDRVSEAFDEAEDASGPVDGLVNNAGVQRSVPAVETTEADLDFHCDVNLKGTVHCARDAAARMLEGGIEGAIVNVASTAAVRPFPGQGPYAASKAGVVAFSKVLAQELGNDGITVNVINPGTVDTPMVQQWLAENAAREGVTEDAVLEDALDEHVLDRMGRPEEIGHVATLLLSEEGEWMTGEPVNVDGGYTSTDRATGVRSSDTLRPSRYRRRLSGSGPSPRPTRPGPRFAP